MPKGTILVVDDADNIRELLCRVVEDMRFKTLGAKDGEEALRILKERGHSIQLVITDINMPRMGGYRLWQEAKGLCPCWLAMTGKRDEDAAKFAKAGITVLDKPFGLAPLRAAIGKALER